MNSESARILMHDKYEWSRPFGSVRHVWTIVTRHGGVTFHATVNNEYGTTCGLEHHYCNPPEYMASDPPSHVNCPVTGGRCWHDGTSLYAMETLWPVIEPMMKNGNHEAIISMLRQHAIAKGL